VSTTDVTLTWNPVAQADLAGYRVYRSLSASGPWGSPLNGSLLTSPSFVDTTGARNTTYFYEVRAVDTSGNQSAAATTSARRSIAFVSSATARTNASTSLSIPRPAGVASGDVLIAAVVSSADVSAPSDWTLLQRTTSGNARLAVFWRTAGSASSYAFSVGGKQSIAATITAYRGVAGVAASSSSANGSSTQILAPGVTTSAQLSAVIGVFATATNATIAPPSGMAEKSEIAAAGKLKAAVETVDQIWPQAGATGPRTATASSAATNVGVLVALTPA
jgi:hypothetical protein